MTQKLNLRIRHIILSTIFILIGTIHIQAETNELNKTQSDSILISYLKEHGIETTNHNELKLLKSGKEKFIDLFQKIEEAKHHIHLEYFNFRNDSIANTLFELLGKKAQEGVEVRAIFDAFGNASNNQPLKKKHLKAIREKGIEIVKFDPIKFPWINHVFHRDHRKIVVIDGTIGYTGGMNIADYYINGLPEIGEWRDMHVRIEGEAVSHLQDIFLDMWNKCTKQDIGGNAYYPYRTSSS
ncbi:MAG: cardiolipin synthase, partial [Bacteroides sp.]|nr:cardiolipin synthase [Bacteroides sp.]